MPGRAFPPLAYWRVAFHARVVDFHLATEPPSSSHGWAHAVSNSPDVRLTVCGLPVGALVQWRDVPIPDAHEDDAAYCSRCTAGVARHRLDEPVRPNGP
jgi:hypothetical protein